MNKRVTSYDLRSTPPERLAKRIARAGLGSRREAERWIAEGRVAVNGKRVASPAINVSEEDRITVDGKTLPEKERTRLWLYHKPAGLVTTHRDPQGRPTVFAALPSGMPRVVSAGRLDLNTEGLLILTNDGALARHLELPSTGWIRRYRARVFGDMTPEMMARLAGGMTVEGVCYGPVIAIVESKRGDNAWVSVALQEGKNREIKKLFEHFGCKISRLIRVAYGPFQLGSLPRGQVKEVPGATLKTLIGRKLLKTK